MKNNNLKTYAKYFTQFIIAVAGLLLIIDFTIHRHAYFHLEEIIGFPGYVWFYLFCFHCHCWQAFKKNSYEKGRLL